MSSRPGRPTQHAEIPKPQYHPPLFVRQPAQHHQSHWEAGQEHLRSFLKLLFAMNGGAAVAVLALVERSSDLEAGALQQLEGALFGFSIGSITVAVSTLLAYFSEIANWHAFQNRKVLNDEALWKRYVDQWVSTEHISDEFREARKHNEMSLEQRMFGTKLTLVMLCFAGVSVCCFAWGVSRAGKALGSREAREPAIEGAATAASESGLGPSSVRGDL